MFWSAARDPDHPDRRIPHRLLAPGKRIDHHITKEDLRHVHHHDRDQEQGRETIGPVREREADPVCEAVHDRSPIRGLMVFRHSFTACGTEWTRGSEAMPEGPEGCGGKRGGERRLSTRASLATV